MKRWLPPDLLPGTPEHAHPARARARVDGRLGIAQRLSEVSDDVLVVGESSLYPALQRPRLNDYVRAEWAASENSRRARYYTLTRAGRKYLQAEKQDFARLIGAIQRVFETV